MTEIIPLSFTEVKELFNAFIEWLKEFAQAVENMFDGISYGFAGYPEENKPL